MPLNVADRVRDTTTTTGTGTITLSGTPPTGYQSFSAVGNGNTTYYTINAGSQWEVGIGTYSGAGPTLSRDTVLSSSNSGSLVNFSAGTKDVFVTYPAEKSVNYDASGNLVVGQTATQLQVTDTASAVNYVQVTGSATGSDPTISAQGSDTDRNLRLTAKGTGAVQSTTRFEVQTGAANYWRLSGAATTATPVLSVLGSDTNINMGLTTKGTGSLVVTTNGSERFRVDGSGRFGFGTSSPAAFTAFTAPPTSATAWTTSGINMVQSAATFTDTSSTGTVTDIRINNFAAQTLAASNPTTVTVLYGTYFTQPAAGTNVTLTSQYALGTDSLRVVNSAVIAGVATLQNAVTFSAATAAINLGTSQTTGVWTAGGASQTGTITLGQSTVSQTANIQAGATASGSTKTINLGTGGLAGSTTAITIGSTTGTSTTTLNGTVSLASTIAAPLGSASAPSYTFTGDTNTGIFSPAADTIAFSEGGTEVMRIDSSGNVGIGTSSPNALLALSGAAAAGGILTRITNTDATGFSSINFGDSTETRGQLWVGNLSYASFGGAGSMNYSANSGPHVWYTNYSERMRIDSSGNVGIGTSSPANITNYKSCTLNGAAGSFSEYRQNEDYVFRVGSDSSIGGFIYHQGAFPIRFLTNNLERFRILATGGITSSDLADAVGYKGLPQNQQTSAYTLALSDMGKHIYATAANFNITIPANATTAFPIGTAITIVVEDQFHTLVPASGVTLVLAGTGGATTGTRTLALGAVATIIKVGTNRWFVSGAGIT